MLQSLSNRARSSACAWVLGAACAVLAGRAAAQADALPLVHVEPSDGHGPLVLILSGDGDWVAFLRNIAQQVAQQGSPVLGLKSRTYLSKPRTPDAAAAALAGAVRAALQRWERSDLIIVGYSRGADLAAFVVNRWPAPLRERVRGIVFVGLSEHAGFEFHLDDLFLDIQRPTDLPTRPEVEKLKGIPLVCIRGSDEKQSFCDHPVEGMRVLTHQGGHIVKGDQGGAVSALVLQEIDRLR